MQPHESSFLWLCAFRYSLGRRTSAPSDFVAIAIKNWPDIPRDAQCLISKELNNAFTRDDQMRSDETISSQYYPLGDDCDRAEWQKLLKLFEGR